MSNLSILIVEDEAIVAEDLAAKVRQMGYDVAGITATGEEAIELARRHKPALVLMDIRLAGEMDGITAAQEIHRGCNLPVLFLTANSDMDNVNRAQQAEAFGYILKPFDDHDLQIQIRMALYKHAAERQLRDSDERLALAMSAAQIGMFDRNLTSGSILWTQIAKAIFGYSQANTTTTTTTSSTEHDQSEWTNRVHPEDMPFIEEESRRCMLEHKPLEVQYRIIWPDGSLHWVETKAVFLYDENDRANRLLGVDMDITERKRVEEEREATVEFLHLTNESRGTKELIHAATAFFQKHSGCEAVGIRLQDGEDYPYYETRGFPEEFVLAEKHLCAHDKAGQLIRDGAGNPVLECMCGNVISGRVNASKPFFTAQGSFWSNCTTELLASTSETDRQARTRNRCNGEGYESVALIPLQLGTDCMGLLQLNDRSKGRFSIETITLWERLAGYLSVAVAKFRTDEKLQALNAELEVRVEERTQELQETREQYLHAEKLSAIGKLSASIAHEINNPLQGIMSILKGVTKRAIVDDEDRKLMEAALVEGDRIKHLIHSLQDFNRPSLGRNTVMDVHDSLNSILILQKSVFNSRRISVVQNYAENLPLILAVPDQIKQVFLNLLTNAADACHTRGGVITISTRQERDRVAVAIQDTGVGIKPSEMEHIFRPFFTTKPDVKGTGLGLSICHGIIKKHNGEIRIESRPGEGATFTVVLPIKGAQEGDIAIDA